MDIDLTKKTKPKLHPFRRSCQCGRPSVSRNGGPVCMRCLKSWINGTTPHPPKTTNRTPERQEARTEENIPKRTDPLLPYKTQIAIRNSMRLIGIDREHAELLLRMGLMTKDRETIENALAERAKLQEILNSPLPPAVDPDTLTPDINQRRSENDDNRDRNPTAGHAG